MDDKSKASFKEKLESQHQFPGLYTFKFIVPSNQVKEVTKLFKGNKVEEKASSQGKYVSVTARVLMTSSDAVINKYVEAKKIEGIISL